MRGDSRRQAASASSNHQNVEVPLHDASRASSFDSAGNPKLDPDYVSAGMLRASGSKVPVWFGQP
jgi:hypothetical protein